MRLTNPNSCIEKEDSGRPELGATMVEYALLIAFIAVVVIAAVTVLGTTVSTHFSNAATQF